MNKCSAAVPPSHITGKRERLSSYQAARRRATDWLLAKMNDDGSIGDPHQGFHFYRAPWTFMLVGETEAASAICGWIRRNMLQSDKTIGGPYRVFDDAWAYRDSALIVGAQMAGQYDLSHGLMPALLGWQDPVSGAFANDRLPDGSMSDDQSVPFAAGPGFACLATGHLDQARAVYRFLQNLYDAQLELPERFYYDWSRSHQAPTTQYPQEKQFWYVVEGQVGRHQRWTMGGIAAGFLCRLYLAEPRSEYLELARRYQAFSMTSTEQQFEYLTVCKSGWGSSLLYLITGEPQYEAWTCRMGDWFVARQHPDGYWPGDTPDIQEGRLIHNALEFVMHINTVIAGLSSRPIGQDA